jgi:hypothetical protein
MLYDKELPNMPSRHSLFRFFSGSLATTVSIGLLVSTCQVSVQAAPDQTGPIRAATAPPKFALLVGIARYGRKGLRPLHGPLNDVRDMRRALVANFGFKSENVVVVPESEANRQNVITVFRRHLRDNARRFPNGTFFFYYSGHGSRTRDLNGDEKQADPSDEFDETLCLRDADLVDDDLDVLNGETRGTPDFTGSLTIVLDSCHSQTATRGVQGEAYEVKSALPDYVSGAVPLLAGNTRGQDRERAGRFAAFSGCLAGQESVDRPFKIPVQVGGKTTSTVEWHGVLTYHLLQVMKNATQSPSNAQVWSQVARVLAGHYNQLPQLEGAATEPFLGGSTRSQEAVITYRVNGNRLSFDQGFEAGAVKGGYIGIYSGGVLQQQLTIISASLGSSTAYLPSRTIVKPNDKVKFLTPYFGSEALTVRMGPGLDATNPVAARLKAYYADKNARFVAVASAPSAEMDAVDTIVMQRGLRPVSGPTGNEVGYFFCRPASAEPIFGKFFVAAPGGDITRAQEESMRELLENYAAQRNLITLTNGAESSLKPDKTVSATLYRVEREGNDVIGWRIGKRTPVSTALPAIFKTNERMQFGFTNQTDKPMYVAVVWLSQDGGITVMQSANREPLITLPPGDEERPEIWSAIYLVGSKTAHESLKVFVSSQPIEISYLTRPPLRAGDDLGLKGILSPFDVIAGQAKGTRGTGPASDPIDFESWGAQDIALEIVS